MEYIIEGTLKEIRKYMIDETRRALDCLENEEDEENEADNIRLAGELFEEINNAYFSNTTEQNNTKKYKLFYNVMGCFGIEESEAE